jgi:hypothetical protein
VFEFIEGNFLPDYGVHSGPSLAWHLNALRTEQDLSSYVQHWVQDQSSGQSPSDSVETALKFVRNVICQRFPRDLMVIDAIQREVLTASNLTAGDYAVFAEQTENLFMPSALFALDEYGVPIQTAQRLASPRGSCPRGHWIRFSPAWSTFRSKPSI